jgi:hypothetical protein
MICCFPVFVWWYDVWIGLKFRIDIRSRKKKQE